MSKADEMFEKLGYKISYENDYVINYWKKKNNTVSHYYFDNTNKQIDVARISNGRNHSNKIITLEQLQAINEKVKELGWR